MNLNHIYATININCLTEGTNVLCYIIAPEIKPVRCSNGYIYLPCLCDNGIIRTKGI